MLKKFYMTFGSGVVVLYMLSSFLGWEYFTPSRNQLPPDARANGYRSFHFWHNGFHGGK